MFDAVPLMPHAVAVNSTYPLSQAILAAVADSIATAQPITVPVDDVQTAIGFILVNFEDVDFDSFPDRITIFGDDSSVWTDPNGDGDEGRFVLNLMRSVSLTANPFNE